MSEREYLPEWVVNKLTMVTYEVITYDVKHPRRASEFIYDRLVEYVVESDWFDNRIARSVFDRKDKALREMAELYLEQYLLINES